MDLQAIINQVKQEQQGNKSLTNTIKPIFEPTELRTLFIQVLNDLIVQKSNGEKSLEVNDENIKVINIICQYLNNEPEFLENEDFSFNKGLWLYGKFGSGKTQLLLAYRKCCKILFNRVVGFKTCVEMNEAFTKYDVFADKKARHLGIATFANRKDEIERIFDDLGEEEITINDFGNKICIMANILSERYKGFPNTKTHVTTNLMRKQISDEYGGRIDSRAFEMFNFIRIGGNKDSIDYRK